jgi:hypothetical protein
VDGGEAHAALGKQTVASLRGRENPAARILQLPLKGLVLGGERLGVVVGEALDVERGRSRGHGGGELLPEARELLCERPGTAHDHPLPEVEEVMFGDAVLLATASEAVCSLAESGRSFEEAALCVSNLNVAQRVFRILRAPVELRDRAGRLVGAF